MKKIIFVISFIVLSGLFFGLTTSEVKAITLSELQDQITRLQVQIAELQRLLSEISSTQVPETGIEPKTTDRAESFAPGRLIVRFKDNVSEVKQKEFLDSQGFKLEKEIKQLKAKIISVPEKAEERLAQALSNNPNIEWAEPDYVAEIQLIPNDPYFDIQWGLEMVQSPEVWDITTGSSDVIIAILDTGIDTSHPDLKDKIVASVNFTGSDTAEDKHGHGTHVAGIAAASTNNAIGVAGLGYDSSLMNVKVLGDTGAGYYAWISSGIIWAADNGAHVINMSLGGTSYSDLMEDAVNYAWNNGVVVVAAAGNRGTTSRSYPAAYDNCIAVAATDEDDVRATWSTYGSWVDVAAPGREIFSTLKNNWYGYMSGTSMASPHVAGLAGLLASIMTDANDNGFINEGIRFIIENTTDNKGTYGIANGRINAFSAINLVADDSQRILTGTISGNGSGTVNVSPPDINYTNNFTRDYEHGTFVNLTATPDYDGGSLFFGWSGDCTGRETCRISMFLDRSVTATFNISHTLNISSTGGGSVLSPGEGEFVYKKDQKSGLRAIADLGYQFVNWTGDTDTIGNPNYNLTTITMKDDYSITANFEPAPECVTHNGYTYCRGFRSTDSQGSSCAAACSARGYICPVGNNMFRSLSEIKEVAFELGLLSSGELTSVVQIEGDSYYSPHISKTLSYGSKAILYDPNWNQICTHSPITSSASESVKICRCEGETITHTLSVSKPGTGSGTITSEPAGINCGNNCLASYDQGTSVTLTATPDTDSVFSGWSGVCTGKETCTVTMNTDKSVTATFDAIDIIDCAKKYGQEYWCSNYEGWEKECQSKGDVKDLPQETFCKDGLGDIYDKCVTCWVPTHTLSVNSSPVTGITIGSTTGHSGTTNYTKTVEEGTSVSLTAPSSYTTPTANYDFTNWSGTGCSSSNNTVRFSVISNMTCTANYKESITTYTLSVSKSGTGSGTVISEPSGIDCGNTCSVSYSQGTSVILTATPNLDFTFTGWSGACTGKETCTITMTSNKSVTATFDKKSTIPEGCTIYNGYIYCRGFSSTDPQGSSCNAACSERGYTCPTGDNMFRSVSQIAQVATTLELLSPGEIYRYGTHRNYYSPYVRTTLSTGAKIIYYDSNWNQICTHAPSTAPNQERVKICRCQEVMPPQSLKDAEYQLASLNNIISQLIDSLTSLIRR